MSDTEFLIENASNNKSFVKIESYFKFFLHENNLILFNLM